MTCDGFVISGNRRLCAFRELLHDKKNYAKCKHFNLIRVVILPSLDASEIEQIEDYLEQTPDIKDPFSWVSRALGYKRRIELHHYSDEQLARRAGIPKKEIRSLIDRLAIVDNYLESIGKNKNYNLVLEDEFAFNRIHSCQSKNKKTAVEKIIFEKFAFISIKNKDSFADRMYKNIPIISEIQNRIKNEIKDRFDDKIKKISKGIRGAGGAIQSPANEDIAIIKFLADSKNEQKIVEIISDNITDYNAEKRGKIKRNGVKKNLEDAHVLLIEAFMYKSSDSDKVGVPELLRSIEKEIKRLKDWINSK